MFVRDFMTPTVDWITPETTLVEAAKRMRDDDVGALPVGDGDKLRGVITDRDIVIRAVAEDKPMAETAVEQAMTDEVLYLYEDQDAAEAAKSMAENAVRRMPVVDREKNLKGIVSLGDLAKEGKEETAGETLHEIAAA